MIGKDGSADGGQQQWQMSAAVESDCGDGLGPPDLVDDWDGDGGGEDFVGDDLVDAPGATVTVVPLKHARRMKRVRHSIAEC